MVRSHAGDGLEEELLEMGASNSQVLTEWQQVLPRTSVLP